MSRQLTSTLLLCAISVGFFIYGAISMRDSIVQGTVEGGIIASLYLITALIAFIALLRLPKKSS
jgi:Ca2+/Na+ antiporter